MKGLRTRLDSAAMQGGDETLCTDRCHNRVGDQSREVREGKGVAGGGLKQAEPPPLISAEEVPIYQGKKEKCPTAPLHPSFVPPALLGVSVQEGRGMHPQSIRCKEGPGPFAQGKRVP